MLVTNPGSRHTQRIHHRQPTLSFVEEDLSLYDDNQLYRELLRDAGEHAIDIGAD